MPRILIIDDEKNVADTCAQVLSSVGHRVATAKDGHAAITLLRGEPADLILTDLDMPYGGARAVGTLRKLHPKIPIIVMSGAGKSQLDMAGILGAHRTLAKPFTSQELIAAVAELLPDAPPSPAAGI